MVADDNKLEFIELVIKQKLLIETIAQINAFKKGLTTIFPEECLEILNEDDLEKLIEDDEVIDWQVWMKHMTYEGISRGSSLYTWFWEIVKELSQKELLQLVYFLSGNYLL